MDCIDLDNDKDLVNEIRRNKDFLVKAQEVNNNTIYKYYFGLVRARVLPEKIENFEYEMLTGYDSIKGLAILELVASIVMVLEIHNKVDMYNALNSVFLGVDSRSREYSIDKALDIIRRYIPDGQEIDSILFTDVIDKISENKKEYIKTMEKRLKEQNDG